MKKLLLLAAGLAAATGLRAFAPHPSVLTVKYGDQMLPVVRVVGTDPVVLVDGQEKRIRTAPTYLIQAVAGFGDNFVQVRRASLGGMEMKVVASQSDAAEGPAASMGPRFGTAYFEAALSAKQAIAHGFVAIVVFSPHNLSGDASQFNRSEIIVHELPPLPAGQDVVVKISAPIPEGQPNQQYFFQVFDDGGREVLSSKMDSAWQYYTMRDRVQLAGVIGRYLEKFAGQNHAAVPVPDTLARPVFTGPAPVGQATAMLSVSAEGQVTEVIVRGVADPAARKSIIDALGGWLFLPQLKAGVPVPTKIQVPLQF